MNYDAILFDLDGTLVDTIAVYETAVRDALKQIGADMTHEQFKQWYVQSLHLKDILAQYGLNEEKVPEIRRIRDALYIERLKSQVEWLPGAKELIESLEGTAPLGLVTGSWMKYVDAIHEKLPVKDHFQTIVTADEIHAFMKPHPHGLLLCADRLGVPPERCIYIGDQSFDVDAANTAGMTSCLVKSYHTPENAEKNAQIVLHSLEELHQTLGQEHQ